ncbi:hypothetical protein B0J18DRAFT_485793 [Chaetomium sp. MPI-SDFR-AT-0129]|nr:hypothetical protein B0J18DRAFT_485793 [Chaetomium sp. MPI-SDFR-AT-0129]
MEMMEMVIMKPWSCPVLFRSAIRIRVTRPRPAPRPLFLLITTTTSVFHPDQNSSVMKFLAPLLFAGVALASMKFTLSVNGTDDESSGQVAKVIPHGPLQTAVGFIDYDNFEDAVLSLNDTGYLEPGFFLQFVSDGVWALVVGNATQNMDITGPFEIDDNTDKFTCTYSSDLAWSLCPSRYQDKEWDIYLTAGSVSVDSCLSAHELLAMR